MKRKSKKPAPKSIQLRDAAKASPLPAPMRAVLNLLSTHVNDTDPARRDDWSAWVGTRAMARATGFSRRTVQIAVDRLFRMRILLLVENPLQRDRWRNGNGKRPGRPANCYTVDLDRLKSARAEDVPAHSGSLRNRQREAAGSPNLAKSYIGLPGSPNGGLPGSPKDGLPGSPELRSSRLPSEVSPSTTNELRSTSKGAEVRGAPWGAAAKPGAVVGGRAPGADWLRRADELTDREKMLALLAPDCPAQLTAGERAEMERWLADNSDSLPVTRDPEVTPVTRRIG